MTTNRAAGKPAGAARRIWVSPPSAPADPPTATMSRVLKRWVIGTWAPIPARAQLVVLHLQLHLVNLELVQKPRGLGRARRTLGHARGDPLLGISSQIGWRPWTQCSLRHG